ncbi:MAG TPA: hypothetical protein VMG12_25735, partial [Polyangiaceae bacterium]|nr:hypothetical protein [Polyangiaceae bacterium]
WQKLSLSRELAHQHPMAHAVLRALELDGYPPAVEAGEDYLARRLGIAPQEVERCLTLLAASGQARKTTLGWQARRGGVVDTGAARVTVCCGRHPTLTAP